MRPVSLTLDGFSSYHEPQTVDFEDVRLACITGHNGAGKSSIFEGMAWGLFGYVTNGDIDSIVNDGCERAEVEFVFDHGNERYRVTRTRVKGKKTSARIDRRVDGDFETFEASGVRAVDKEIEKLIRISPDTFVATVLMGQEDSGRFARATPAERKEILSEIIGLDQYQELAKGAREHMRTARQAHSALQEQIDAIDVSLAGADSDTTQLVTTNARLSEIEPLLTEAQSVVESATAALSTRRRGPRAARARRAAYRTRHRRPAEASSRTRQRVGEGQRTCREGPEGAGRCEHSGRQGDRSAGTPPGT